MNFSALRRNLLVGSLGLGVIVEQGEAKALFAAPKEERTRQFLSKFLADGRTPQ